MKIKVKEITEGCAFSEIEKGDWTDLRAAKSVAVTGPYCENNTIEFGTTYIPLGIAMELPAGYEAIILPRSSTFKNYKVLCVNSAGVVDNSYNGDNDEWRFPVLSIGPAKVNKGDRICQFRIQLSQKATIWQKIKWLFTSKIEFEWVDHLGNSDRGGFGSTGIN